jgi:hypothetical protein
MLAKIMSVLEMPATATIAPSYMPPTSVDSCSLPGPLMPPIDLSSLAYAALSQAQNPFDNFYPTSFKFLSE